VDALVARLLALPTALGRRVAVGISGIDCAGKSTLAEALRIQLARHGVPSLVVSGDEFTRPTEERNAATS
jgi:uridine kinase